MKKFLKILIITPRQYFARGNSVLPLNITHVDEVKEIPDSALGIVKVIMNLD